MKKIQTRIYEPDLNNNETLKKQALYLINYQLDTDIKHFKSLKEQKQKNELQHNKFLKSNWFYEIDKKQINREIREIRKRIPNIESFLGDATEIIIEPTIEEKLDLPVPPETKSTITDIHNHPTCTITKSEFYEKYNELCKYNTMDYNHKVQKFKSAILSADYETMQEVVNAIFVLNQDRIQEFITSISNENTDHDEQKVIEFVSSISFAYEYKSKLESTPEYQYTVEQGWFSETYPIISLDKIKEEIPYINPPFKYIGNKYKLLEQIIPEFDYSKNQFVEIFCGGGSVYTNVIGKYEKIIINDINPDIIGIHKSLLFNTDGFLDTVKSYVPGKNDLDKYLELRNSYNEHKTPEKLFVLMFTCFSNIVSYDKHNKFNQSFRYRTWNKKIGERINEFVEHVHPFKGKITFLNDRFENVHVPQNSIVYLDPPYSQCRIGYGHHWKNEDNIKLYEYLKKIHENKNSFVLSGLLSHDGKESELINKLIEVDGIHYKIINWDYSNISQSKRDKKTVEVIVKNF